MSKSEYVRNPREDTDEKTIYTMEYFAPRVAKKVDGKPLAMQSIMINTFSASIMILDRIRDVPFYELALSTFAYCKDTQFAGFAKKYEAQIELAGCAPERFVMNLHSFYNEMASKIKKPELLPLFFQFMGFFMRLRYTKYNSGINQNVILAYTDLILQQLDYLRPSKFDLSNTIVGLTLEGQAITIKDPFAYADMAGWDSVKAHFVDKLPPPSYEDAYRKYGYLGIDSYEEANALGRRQRIFNGVRAALLPFINEYTFDIVPANQHSGNLEMMSFMKANLDIEALLIKLKSRRRTLPTNGVHIEFEDSTEVLKTLLLKEIVEQNTVFLLFKLTNDEGDISGYYDTNEEYFFTTVVEAKVDTHYKKSFYDVIRAIVLFCYASNVLDDPLYSDDCFMDAFENFVFPIKAKSFGKGGALRNVYNPSPEAKGSRKDDARYDTKQRVINGYVRKLPAGQNASEEAKRRAERLGYKLEINETYISPFVKTVIILKNSEDEEKQNES